MSLGSSYSLKKENIFDFNRVCISEIDFFKKKIKKYYLRDVSFLATASSV